MTGIEVSRVVPQVAARRSDGLGSQERLVRGRKGSHSGRFYVQCRMMSHLDCRHAASVQVSTLVPDGSDDSVTIVSNKKRDPLHSRCLSLI